MLIPGESGNAGAAERGPPAEFACGCTENHDADEAAQRLQAWNQEYRRLTPGRFEGLTTELWFESMQDFRERSNRRIYQTGRAWPRSVTFCIPLAMEGPARFCGQSIDLESMLVPGLCGELDFLTSPTLDIIGISIPQDKLASFGASQPAFDSGSDRTRNRLIRMNPGAASRLRVLTLSLFESIEPEPARLANASVREQIRDEIVDGLAAPGVDCVAQPLNAERHASESALVRRATDYMVANRSRSSACAKSSACRAAACSTRSSTCSERPRSTI
jgi:AraC family ethanolamine operon transcriptional activator